MQHYHLFQIVIPVIFTRRDGIAFCLSIGHYARRNTIYGDSAQFEQSTAESLNASLDVKDKESMPVRDIPIGTRAVTGRHARSGARYESSLERDFFELMMSDPMVEKIEEQPVRINYIDTANKCRRYTPDALVTFKRDPITKQVRPPLLCEVKYREEYRRDFLKFKERIRAARRYANEREWQFKVVTDREIRTHYLRNVHFLAGYRDREPDLVYVTLILDHLGGVGTATPATLLAAITSDLWKQADMISTLWWLVAHSKLKVDLSVPLSMHSPVLLPTWQ